MPYAYDYFGNSLPGGWMGQGREPFNAQPRFNRSGAPITSPLDLTQTGPSMNMGNLDIRPAHLRNPQPTAFPQQTQAPQQSAGSALSDRGRQELAHLAGGGSRFGIMQGVPQQYQSGAPAQGGLAAASLAPFGNSPTNTGPDFRGPTYGGMQDQGMIPGGPLPGNPGQPYTFPPIGIPPPGPTTPGGTNNPQNPYTQDPYNPTPSPGGGIRTPTFDANPPIVRLPGSSNPGTNPGTNPPASPTAQPPGTTTTGGNWVHNPGPGERWIQNPAPGTGGGQNGVGMNTNYGASINTSITPGGIYSPQQTQAATNQAIASQHAMADPYTQLKLTTRPGFSRSASNAALALPGIMQGRLGGAQAAFEIPFLDTQANLQHQLAGETAREGEGIDWGNVLARLMEQQSRQRTSAFGPAVGLADLLLG